MAITLQEALRQLATAVVEHERVISVGEAARKYGMPQYTLSRLVKRGKVRVVQPQPGKGLPTLLDEASVARAAQQYHANPPRRGRPRKQPGRAD